MPVSVNQLLANTLGLADPLGRIADDGRVGFNGRANISGRPIRFGYSFDGVDDYAVLPYRAINPDGDIDIEWEQRGYDSAVTGAQTIVAQCNSTTLTSREFILRSDANESVTMIIGGSSFGTAVGAYGNGKWRSLLVGNSWSVFKDGALVLSTTITRGAAREPTARTTIAARDAAGAQGDYIKGQLYNIRINGVLWAIQDRNQTIQLPSPSGLGAELITPTVLENPAVKGSQWTYLGGGRWQLISDGSGGQELRFLNNENQPEQGYLEFEIESISGVGSLTCTNNVIARSVFNTTGVKRFFYTSKFDVIPNGAVILFKRAVSGQPLTCIIKNISFKPLSVVSSTELVPNGDFSAGTTGWTTTQGGSISVTSGQATLTTVAGQISRFERGVTLEANSYYEVSMQLISLSGNTAATLLLSRNAAGSYALIGRTQTAVLGRMSFIILAPATDALIQIRGDEFSAGTVVVDNVSIRKLDSLCNPLTLVNTTSDRWQEVPQ